MLKRLQHRAQGQEGFTLIELLVVILIIGILAAVAIPTFLSQTGKANDSNVQSNLNTIETAEATYNTTSGNYTSSNTTLGNVEPTINSMKPVPVVTTGTTQQANAGASDTSSGSSSSALQYQAAITSSTGVTYFLSYYNDGFVADTCYVPTGKNAGACNTSSGGTGAGTWGNGNS